MLINYDSIDNIYLVCGKTDLRRGIDGLASVIMNIYKLDPYENSIFLFCGSRLDRYKGLYWDGDGFYLLYKRIENGKLQWPRDSTEARKLSKQEIRWLLEGLSLNQKKAIKKRKNGGFL